MPVVGLADETSAHSRLCGISLVRSSRRQPSTTERPGGDDLSQGGGCTDLLIGTTDVSVNLGDSQRGESIGQMGGQNYLGAKWLFPLFGEQLGVLAEPARLQSKPLLEVARECQ